MKQALLFLCLISFVFLNFEKPLHQPLRKGKDYALFFAVNKYQSPKLTTLQNPIGDAKRIAQELQNSYGFQTEVVENPTYETIELKLKEYNDNFAKSKFDKDGQLLIFFSGHGSLQLKNGYFLPSNANPDDLKRSAFNYKIWRDDMDAIDCKHILVAIDACYSGSFDPKFGMKTDGLFGTRAGELNEGQRLIAEHEKHKTRLFFTSGESDQPTPDKSDFAKKFLAALLTKGYGDGVLTSSEMFSNHLEKAAPRPRTGEFGNDEAGSSFVFVVENTKNTEGVSNLQKEADIWKNATMQNTLYAYQEYLRLYPKGDFSLQARYSITDFEVSAWASTKEQNTYAAYKAFLDKYPLSIYIEPAKERIRLLNEKNRDDIFKIGDKAPDITLPNTQGNLFKLSDLKGKVVLLHLWGKWCDPCRLDYPQLIEIYDKFKSKGFEIFSVSKGETRDKWVKAIFEDKLNWDFHVIYLKGANTNRTEFWVDYPIPTYVLIGRDEKIKLIVTGAGNIDKVQKELKKMF